MAHCPYCRTAMEIVHVDGVDIDRCKSCYGIFFDNFELKKVEKKLEETPHPLLAEDSSRPISERNPFAKINCPKCTDIVMIRRFWNPRSKISIETCGKCGGLWLDAGVLSEIHAQESSEEGKRRQAAEIASEKAYLSSQRQLVSEMNRAFVRRVIRRF